MKIRLEANPSDSIVIKELLSPWNVSFTNEENAEVTFVYRVKAIDAKRSVIIPSDDNEFVSWAKKNRLHVNTKLGTLFSVGATTQTSLFITPQVQYCFDGLSKPFFKNGLSSDFEVDENTVVLKMDVVQEFNNLINKTLCPKQSALHRIVTGLPIPYGLAPTRLRDFLMRTQGPQNLSLYDKLPIDALRFALVNSIEKVTGRQLERKTLFNNNYVCMFTHDVETAPGLQRAVLVKKIEERYDIPSAWYLPSKRYKLNDDSIRQLSNHGEVGAHDTKHDGKLVHLSKDKLVERFSDVRQCLGRILQQSIDGFRAPILQHNIKILHAINEAGFTYDTSIPSWEPKHPYTMGPHGIGTVFPLKLGELMEIPLTLPQDHQMLNVLGLGTQDVIRIWASMANTIRDLGGVCMFLVHPDYEIAADTELYEELVSSVISDSKSTITVPSRLSTLLDE